MPILLQDAKGHLNIDLADTTDDTELQFFVDAANEWIATQVTDTSPAPVQLATRELVRHLWDTQREPAGGSEQLDPPDENWHLGLLGFSIPTRVRELIGPYRRAVSAIGSFPTAPIYGDATQDSWPIW